jgi:hypothetical protein
LALNDRGRNNGLQGTNPIEIVLSLKDIIDVGLGTIFIDPSSSTFAPGGVGAGPTSSPGGITGTGLDSLSDLILIDLFE